MKLLSTYIMGALFGAGLLYLTQFYGVTSWVQNSFTPESQEGSLAYAGDVKGVKSEPSPEPTQEQQSEEELFVESEMQRMNIKQKIGQMFMWQVSEKKLSDKTREMIEQTQPGGVILMGNRTLSDISVITKELRAVETVQPLFIAIDQEGGVVKRLIDDPNPGAPALGKMEEEKICSVVANTSQLLSENGVNMNFGIVADIAWFKDSFIANRTFSPEVEVVSNSVEQSVMCTKGVFSTVKHFPGHGRTKLNSHVTIPVVQTLEKDWSESDAVPFQKAIDAGVDVMMMGHLVYEEVASEPASLSQKHIQRVRDMGFEGVITTDDMGMLEESGEDAYESLDKAINSGIDMMLYVRTDEEPIDLYEHAVESMVTSKNMEDRIDESVNRILQMKYKLKENAI